MKRSPLRRKSKRRPVWENRELVKNYLADNRACELWELLREHGELSGPVRAAVDPHHSWYPPRWDLLSNLVAVSREAHEWIHSHEPDGRIVAMFVKWNKGEFDVEELRIAAGKDVLGWLEISVPKLEWVSDLRNRILGVE